jgi:hypothetical protein
VVVIQKALAISNIVLKIAGDPFEKGKAPFSLQGTTIVMETKIVPQHKPEPVLFKEIVSPDLPVSKVSFNIRVIVILGRFGDTVPCLQEKGKRTPFKTEVHDCAVPASR